MYPEWAPAAIQEASHLPEQAGGSLLLKPLIDRLNGLFFSRFPTKYTLWMHYVENSCISWDTRVGICTFSKQYEAYKL